MKAKELFDEFYKFADEAKMDLEQVLDLISKGCVPSVEKRKSLDSSIDILTEKYNAMCELAKEALEAEEIPQQGSSIKDFYDAIINSESEVLKNQINNVRKTLQRFISVQSLVANLADTLKPFQENAEILLGKMNVEEGSEIENGKAEELIKSVSGPSLFVQAIEQADLNTDEGNRILDELEEVYSYPSKITRGLAGKKFYIPADGESVIGSGDDKSEEDQDNETESGILTTEKNGNEVQEADHEEEYPENVIEESVEGEKNEPNEEGKSPFVDALEAGCAVIDESDFGEIKEERSEAEVKKITASGFTSDLRKGNVRALSRIVQEANSTRFISAEAIEKCTRMPKGLAEISIAFLYRKGYLRHYILSSAGDFYGPSNRLIKALEYKEARKFVDAKPYPVDDVALNINTPSSAAARKAFVNILEYFGHSYSLRGHEKFRVSHGIMKNSFMLEFGAEPKQGYQDVCLGFFWSDYSDCEEFAKNLKIELEENKELERLVIAAFNVDLAQAFISAFSTHILHIPDSLSVSIYALGEDKFYSIDGEEQQFSEVWQTGEEEIEETETNEPNGDKFAPEEIEEHGSITPEVRDDNDLVEKICVEKDGKKNSDEATENAPKHVTEVKNDRILNALLAEKGIIYKLLDDKKDYCAVAYSKCMAMKNATHEMLYERMAYAYNDPMRHCTYSAGNVFNMIPERRSYFDDSLMVAIGIRTFFSNQVKYDYNIMSVYNAIKDYEIFDEYPALSRVLYELVEFKEKQKQGMDAYADYHAKTTAQLEEELKKGRKEAGIFYENTIQGWKSEKASQKRFLETKKLIFAMDSDIGQYIKAVSDDDRDMLPLMLEYLQNNFFREGDTIDEDGIDQAMLWDFIMTYWEKAGDKMVQKYRANLMSHLRSNIISITTKALQIMIRWCNVVQRLTNQTEDGSVIAYKRVRKNLLEEIDAAIDSISASQKTAKGDENLDKRAGREVILFALDEIKKCIKGTYEGYEKRFFYVPFLLTSDVILDENYCPDLDVHMTDVEMLQPEQRILKHASSKLSTPTERLDEILEENGDDYGTARLLVDYLGATSPTVPLAKYIQGVMNDEYAKETAELKKTQFVGDLELAQSYGQIDNTNATEDKKERILQVIDFWHEWAIDSSNYGFFERVLDGYLEEIRRSAKSRERVLLAQLDAFKGNSTKGLSLENKERRIAKIQLAISQQNYTVAEDLLARASQIEDDQDNVIEEEFLKDFLDDYNDYYKPVANGSFTFSALVSKHARNKEERGGRRLADNWLPGGRLGKERLNALLTTLGFSLGSDAIVPQNLPIKYENYVVKTTENKKGKQEYYTHPIAAFGSGAARDGFRVVCLNGKFDAPGLIDVMKQIGNTKHTMILLDYALDKPERRLLARKSKAELGDKLFVVVDRTVMMYMVKNYDETKVNRMLMALITPFGYYQPYVWESANVMPPEIFMGRKIELERIESATGANIVYGGRQLGKSALLKKAMADIDGNENGDRAVLVEIKGLDYRAAAKKIGQYLYDAGILEKDLNTEDWDVLSREIRKRLQYDKNRIPYLLLLLDEADAFIESCEKVNYKPFDSLKEIQSIGVGRFKFVIAGLRNIVRFKRDAALGNNSVLTHLEAMTVKPFQPSEARELMEIPLHYLGLEFPKENENLKTLILATTNYFPGLIQMYCAKLLSAMRKKDYAGYDEADTPVYEISEDHIKKVLADPEFMNQIREKFVITLKLDEDNYYYLIALIIAHLYYNNGANEGYSSEDVKTVGLDFGIRKIAELDIDKVEAFMEEMKELNVLRSADNIHYLFARFSFLQLMGARAEVDDKLAEYMED